MPGYPFAHRGRFKDVSIGQRFGQLTVLDIIPPQEREDHKRTPGRSLIRLRCDCGSIVGSEIRYLMPGTENRTPRTSCGGGSLRKCSLLAKPEKPPAEKATRQCLSCGHVLRRTFGLGGRPATYCNHACQLAARREKAAMSEKPEYFTTSGRGPGVPSKGFGRIGVTAFEAETGDDCAVRYLVVTKNEESEHDSFLEAASEFRIRTGRAAS